MSECKSAMLAALEQIQETCEGEGGTYTELDTNGTLVYIPSEVKELKSKVGNPVSEEELDTLFEESPWLGNWASAMCKISGVGPEDPEHEECMRTWAKRALM